MHFILYGIKDSVKYYISNLDPLAWTSAPLEAKKYSNRYNGESDILRNYVNYNNLKKLIKDGYLDKVYIASIEIDPITRNINETWRLQLIC